METPGSHHSKKYFGSGGSVLHPCSSLPLNFATKKICNFLSDEISSIIDSITNSSICLRIHIKHTREYSAEREIISDIGKIQLLPETASNCVRQARPCLTHGNPVWPSLAQFGWVWPSLAQFGPVWPRSTHFNPVQPSSAHGNPVYVTTAIF